MSIVPDAVYCCVISFFYIKPQLRPRCQKSRLVVLYLSSTSNHNYSERVFVSVLLCYIFLLHQTTTGFAFRRLPFLLCYIFLLHQTTTLPTSRFSRGALCYIFLLHQTTTEEGKQRDATCCVISFFYIKPQL